MILHRGRTAVLALSMLAFAACSSGSSSGGGGNTAPTANAGIDQNVSEMSTVQLNGTGNDADGNALTYSWTQTAGASVAITNSDTATASFTAPDVVAGSPETLTFQLRVSDGTASATDTVNVTVAEPQPQVMVSGTVNYEWVPPRNNCNGLDFNSTFSRPIRGAPVQLLDSGNNVLGTTVAGDDGSYVFNNITANTMVHLRVRAELKKITGTSRWDVEVRDNVDTSGSPPPLESRPLYVVESSNFNSGAVDISFDLIAPTGWTGSSYTEPRAAAPFSILDAIYQAVKFIESADPNATFAPLNAFWSVNNTATVSGSVDAGELGTSFYSSSTDSLFLVGDATHDTEEFDDHVIVHEWGHYFEDNFSRSDSTGGPHAVGQRIDPRVAFGEGWATAIAGMALNNHLYCDTLVPGTSSGFGIGAESGSYNAQGWYDEVSVVRFVYDLWDDNDEGGDSGSLGFAPIYDVMTGPQAFTDAFTSVFSFATELRATLSPTDQAFLDSQLAREDMTALGLDIWGTHELNTAGGAPDVMPIYTDITADGTILPVCVNSQFDSGRDGNKLSENRFLRISVPITDQYDVTMTTTTATPPTDDPNDRDQSDPDIFIFQGPQYITEGTSPAENSEVFRTPTLQAGMTYIAVIEEWRFDDELASTTYPEQICFDVSFTPTP